MCARTCDWRSGSAPPVYTLYRASTTNDTVTIFTDTVPKRPDELISTGVTAGPLTVYMFDRIATRYIPYTLPTRACRGHGTRQTK